MSTYRPVGYCSSCRRPIYQLSDLSAPCAHQHFGTPCKGAIVCALDVQAWEVCPSCPQQPGGEDNACTVCGGCGWIPRERAEDKMGSGLQLFNLSNDSAR